MQNEGDGLSSGDNSAEKHITCAGTQRNLFISSATFATRFLFTVLKQRAGLFICLQLVAFIGAQYFRYSETVMAAQTSENIPLLATNAGLSISFDLIWHAIFFMVTVLTTVEVARGHGILPKRASASTFNELLIENTRVIARVIFWLPFFLVPAAYRYIRMSMVSFVVLLDSDYEAGEVDALKKSDEITRGHFLLCLFSLLLAGILEPLAAALMTRGEISVFSNPVGALLSIPVSLITQTWAMIFLFAIYARLAKLHIRS